MSHTPGSYNWRKYGQSDEDIARLRSVDMEPTLMLTNEGQVALMAGDGDDRKRIALIDCQTHFKRGQGYKTECAERDANANLFSAAPDLLACLRKAHCPGGGYTGQPANEEPTVDACLKAGVCGCYFGAAVTKATPPSGKSK